MSQPGADRRKPRILLLNPPGARLYVRDYFCSKVAQADYLHPPIDLVVLSGALDGFADLEVIDAIARRLSPEAAIAEVVAFQPDAVIGLIGSVSLPEDGSFYSELKRRWAGKLALIGDVLIEDRSRRLRDLPFADALLHDFCGGDALTWLRGGPGHPGLRNLTVREGSKIRALPIVRQRGAWPDAPVPRHELFVGNGYRNPFLRSDRFAAVLTEFGCPYRCNFCVMSTLGWRVRPVENVLAEFDHLKAIGVNELFLLDQTFGIDKARARELLKAMTTRDYGFGWVCFSRPDVIDDPLLAAMRQAGCHTVILGLESGSEEVLRSARKDYLPEQIRAGFAACARNGLRTVATVILGLPEETEATFRRTLEFLREVDPDFASFNVAAPRMGTPLRKKAIALGLIDPRLEVMDQSGSPASMPTLTLSRSQVDDLRRRAVDGFYFRATYLRKRLRRTVSRPGELFREARQAYWLLKKRLRST